MHELILWSGFLGAWLLVAAPLYQAALPRDVMASWVTFMNKATAWFYVASGAFLIALKETSELVEGQEWPTAVFSVLVVVMAGIATGNTAVRMGWTHQPVDQK
jgi:hypothetical protein